MDQRWWIQTYQQQKALWIHDGNPARPHAELTSGNHSNGFFNSRLIIPNDKLMLFAARDLIDRYVASGGSIEAIDRVVGPQTGATKLALFMATCITQRRTHPCQFASPEKRGDGNSRQMVFTNPAVRAFPNERILLCEDVITTGGSVDLTAKACLEAEAQVLPIVLVLVNRSGVKHESGRNILALIDKPMPIWPPDNCPLCQQGSQALRPKDNWDALNGNY